MKTRLIGAILAIVLALVGTVVLTGYVRDADARAADGAAFVPVYVVTTEIPKGTAVGKIGSFIEVKQIPAIAAVPGRVTKLSAIAGKVAQVPLKPGEQLIKSRWVDTAKLAAQGDATLPEGMQALTLALPVEQVVGGAVKAGDSVGVIIAATKKAADGSDIPVSKQVVHKVLVTAVQQGATTTPTKKADAETEPVSVVMVTLARTTPDIEKIVWGQKFGTVWLTIEPKTADETGSSMVDGNVVFQ